MSREGVPIVLTADRTLMSEYGGSIFMGFSACIPKGLVPDRLYFSLFCPPVKANEDGSVEVAPCGTRKVEATLLEHGFRREDVIVAHPEHLDKVVGSRTKALGVTENDPLGIGPATSTFTGIFGGEAYMAIKFKELLNDPAVKKFKPKVIVGGPGAWQLEDEEIRKKLGIDCVVIGEGEKVVVSLFEKALNGEELPPVVHGEPVPAEEIPFIKGATIDGIVEIARGCGRGCDFCVPTMQRYRCLPISHILKDVDVNVRAGRQPILHAEDVLRYGARGIEVDKEAVISLFRSVRGHPGVNGVGMSHFALASVASAPEVVEEISNILEVDEKYWLSGQTGIETGSPELIKRYMRGKCKPFTPDDWPQVVLEAFDILAKNNWVPCATLIMGLPGETEKDVEYTISLIEELRPFKSLIIPLFLVAMGGLKGRLRSFKVEDMTVKHTMLLLKCWEHNLKWAPTLIYERTELSIGNPVLRRGLRVVLSYGIRQAERLIRICRDEYGCNLKEMIGDAGEGKIKTAPLAVKFLYNLLKIREI